MTFSISMGSGIGQLGSSFSASSHGWFLSGD
jgi:hypothetical protein